MRSGVLGFPDTAGTGPKVEGCLLDRVTSHGHNDIFAIDVAANSYEDELAFYEAGAQSELVIGLCLGECRSGDRENKGECEGDDSPAVMHVLLLPFNCPISDNLVQV